MLPNVSVIKKSKSPGQDAVVNTKTSITCSSVPESLFDATTAKKHFSKFGRVQKIRLFPKRFMCIVEYDQPSSAERAILNAGAFDGFMFDVTRTKARIRRKSKREDDPDWAPDSDVEEELSAMGGAPTYMITRQKSMDVEPEASKVITPKKVLKKSPTRKKVPVRDIIKQSLVPPPPVRVESPVAVTMTQTSLSTIEAATELHLLRSKISLTPDEQWRTLDARDRILRGWGGAGSRVKVGGATIGTCPDMCPEKELLHRQAEHQVMTLETVPDSDGQLEPRCAVKQYSRSSADQEMPMCYELRPAPVLMRTCAYLLHEVADTARQVSLADWFHFMWDRFRGIRKDITQQALCCAESICLVEMCARFHAHCAARLADLEHTQFDQKLNTDNLTKCLQTLKHMYADVSPEQKPKEAEFRGYVALLNLGDANFWWEIKQLPEEIQKSEPITFAIKVFNAIDNNNYVRFFRLVKEKATYLQACILLRYFNDVRARALARVVKAYAPRGGSRFPAEDLINALAFESMENMKAFINHYGLRFAKSEDCELAVILDRNQFIEDSDPYPVARAINLIESKRQCSVGEVIAGGNLPTAEFNNHILYTSFNKDGKLKDAALIAEDQGYDTVNDSNKDVQALKAEIQRLSRGEKTGVNMERLPESRRTIFVKPEPKTMSPRSVHVFSTPKATSGGTKLFSFKPAIPVAPTEIIKNSPEKIFQADTKNIFSFSKPQDSVGSFVENDTANVFMPPIIKSVFDSKTVPDNKNLFAIPSNETKNPFQNAQYVFRGTKPDDTFKKPEVAQSIFGSKPVFTSVKDETFLAKPDSTVKFEKGGNIFAKASFAQENDDVKRPSNIFGSCSKLPYSKNIFMQPVTDSSENKLRSVFAPNGDVPSNNLSPGSLFKSACNPPNGSDTKSYSIFQSKNKAQSVADNILNSITAPKNNTVYEFDQNNEDTQRQLDLEHLKQEKIKEDERKLQEKLKKEEELKHKLRLQEENRRKEEEERKKQKELKELEEKRKNEEQRKQKELKKKMEEEKKAELKRKAEEEEKKFRQAVETKSSELVEELVHEVNIETIRDIIKEELKNLKNLMNYASEVTEDILENLCKEICHSEMKAEKFWTDKITKKWFYVWRKQFIRNSKRRSLLEDTPVWLTDRTPLQEASNLRRLVENAALKNMNAIHRGYKFIGELRQSPSPEPYNIMEIIRSPLLRRMKQISYPYDKCFFWKVTLVSPGANKWLCRKINVEKWVLDVFSDKKKHEESDSLIHVGKQSWNHLMDFAISVSLTNNLYNCGEAMDGCNGVLFYNTENEYNLVETIKETLKQKYPYQVIPVAVIIPKMEDVSIHNNIQTLLTSYVTNKVISAFKIFILDRQNIFDSLNASTKSALKWMAKNCPQNPPLEIDFLKSVCQRYLGNDIWCRFKYERDGRMNTVLKDLNKLIECYNTAVDKLTDVITNEDLFNFSSFPLEFKIYLDDMSPYPKPYEFIPSSVRNSENISAIKDLMKQLKLPNPSSTFNPHNAVNMQQQIREYCYQISWFENPEEVVCKVVAVLPNQLADLNMSCEDFSKYFAQYDLLDLLNVIVYEKINKLNNFNNRFAIYERSVLEDYRNAHWLYELNVFCEMKHKALEYEDDLDYYIEAKRRKIAMDSIEYLMLEDKDCTIVEENIKETEENITKYSNCTEAVKQLEREIEEGKKKSVEFENLLRAALSDV